MDDIVRQAMAKWPNVPHCYGWLGLDARGGWYMRDDVVQAAGPFQQARGSLLRHSKLIDFIERNYECDVDGCWYFQNGPQRVYVELELAPLVLRVDPGGETHTHVGRPVQVTASMVDEHGHLFFDTGQGLALVHTLDVLHAANLIEARQWTPEDVRMADLPTRFGFVLSPASQKKPGH